ncbi:zinc ribbon domain-containing protein [Saccharophagus sp. K07]|jgi:putative FmdB family regulatory protein|uniref:zinc ribbon domain-containing protein n=1 Tax=Saccharophagus sp. K07 TaxID=2283636 RepID=UPI00165271F3|nr:zinc ribbon domain-containing protein [Saccharophagus sp. K07]MBC6903900.1 zinc ribbon domain-containing protein [Saccharophagus sp. K07]
MPVYDYRCREHGVFYQLQTMENHDKPVECPTCAQLCPRIIMLPPELLLMDPDKRLAHATNEKSRHEPIISSQDRRQHDHRHRQQCGCDHGLKKSKLFYTARGEKMFPSMRPWMISH